MRQPPRQPPRQAPKPARGGGARKPPAQRAKAPARKAPARKVPQQKGPAPKGATATKGGKLPPLTDAQQKSLQYQRNLTYWAMHGEEKEVLYDRQHAAGGEAIGTVLNADRRARWKTSYAIGAIAFLILAGYTGAMAFGAGSLNIALISFTFLAISVGFVTAEFSQRHFPEPLRHPPIAQHRLEDLIFEDDPTPRQAPPVDKTEVNSMDDLDQAFNSAASESETTTAVQSKVTADTAVLPAVTDDSEATVADAPLPKPDPAAEVGPENAPPAASEATKADAKDTLAKADAADDLADSTAENLPKPDPNEPVGPENAPEPASEEQKTAASHLVASQHSESGSPAASEPIELGPAAGSGPRHDAAAPSDSPSANPPADNATAEVTSASADSVNGPVASGLSLTDVRDVAATLVVANLDRSVEFYTQNLRLIVVDRTDEAALLEAGFGRILLWQRDDAPDEAQGIMHLTFEVGDLESTYRTMRTNGVDFAGEPADALEGQNFQLRAAAFTDPDGHGLAITERQDSP
ncbi:VOC family protein [Natronoglycomyces albus]|uniref:VOC family protein n=1 Tax=Natronoglycomyces albus TaxID=2811108 RepID=A0A895XKZ8_9ACTN|nr:VOC family protein [Natronoglycomyces albus]QSB06004.1 VOC family protein [Natronoglycomyces albus]